MAKEPVEVAVMTDRQLTWLLILGFFAGVTLAIFFGACAVIMILGDR